MTQMRLVQMRKADSVKPLFGLEYEAEHRVKFRRFNNNHLELPKSPNVDLRRSIWPTAAYVRVVSALLAFAVSSPTFP